MQIDVYGYYIPESDDASKGSTGWMKRIEQNTSRFSAHRHDGNDSVLLTPAAISPFSQSIAAGDWSASGSGYRQLKTVPAGVTEINNYVLKFVASAPSAYANYELLLSYERVSATTYYLYSNDNTVAGTMYFR